MADPVTVALDTIYRVSGEDATLAGAKPTDPPLKVLPAGGITQQVVMAGTGEQEVVELLQVTCRVGDTPPLNQLLTWRMRQYFVYQRRHGEGNYLTELLLADLEVRCQEFDGYVT